VLKFATHLKLLTKERERGRKKEAWMSETSEKIVSHLSHFDPLLLKTLRAKEKAFFQ